MNMYIKDIKVSFPNLAGNATPRFLLHFYDADAANAWVVYLHGEEKTDENAEIFYGVPADPTTYIL